MSATTYNSPAPPNRLFVYGTLMRGEVRHHLLSAAGIQSISPASIAGDLLDLGDYPGLQLSTATKERVVGELIEFESLDKIISDLDEEEGPEFRRELVNVTLPNGRGQFAWTYVLAGQAANGRDPIPTGNWRNRSARAQSA